MSRVAPGAFPTVQAYISLGSNLGDRLGHLARGLRHLLAPGQVDLVAVSSVYETEPWGKTDQGPFLNAAVAVRTALEPRELLYACRAAERAEGRVRLERWGPRTLDVDIVLYGEVSLSEPDLVIPHPRLAERAFVLVPLLEIEPALRLPGGPALSRLLSALPDQGVRLHLPAAAFLERMRRLQ